LVPASPGSAFPSVSTSSPAPDGKACGSSAWRTSGDNACRLSSKGDVCRRANARIVAAGLSARSESSGRHSDSDVVLRHRLAPSGRVACAHRVQRLISAREVLLCLEERITSDFSASGSSRTTTSVAGTSSGRSPSCISRCISSMRALSTLRTTRHVRAPSQPSCRFAQPYALSFTRDAHD
jgi:hypothetical protein